MSGDSSQQTYLKKKEDESHLVLPERSGTIPVTIGAGTGAVAATELPPDIDSKNSEETQDLIKRDPEETKVNKVMYVLNYSYPYINIKNFIYNYCIQDLQLYMNNVRIKSILSHMLCRLILFFLFLF